MSEKKREYFSSIHSIQVQTHSVQKRSNLAPEICFMESVFVYASQRGKTIVRMISTYECIFQGLSPPPAYGSREGSH
jgi:hypothetical protein